jgi:nucleoside-diphosphate-sugar epimerase
MTSSLILGCGYLGARLARVLIAHGHVVVGTTRSGLTRSVDASGGAVPARWDSAASDAETTLEALARDATWVFFTAAPSAGASYESVYLAAALHMAAVLPRTAARAVVMISSTSVYGVADGSWVDEETLAEPSRGGGAVLLAAERALLEAAGLPARIVRAAGIYGPGRTPFSRVREGARVAGAGEAWVNLIHVDDLASIAAAAAERGVTGRAYLAADGAPVRRADYYAEAARLIEAPEPVFAGGDAGPHVEGLGKRIRSRRTLEELGVTLRYPDYRAGLRASLPRE